MKLAKQTKEFKFRGGLFMHSVLKVMQSRCSLPLVSQKIRLTNALSCRTGRLDQINVKVLWDFRKELFWAYISALLTDNTLVR